MNVIELQYRNLDRTDASGIQASNRGANR
jgi:hypothetical protein